MKQDSRHITRKVVMGYVLLIALAVCSVGYIYNVIRQLAEEDGIDTAPRQKVYLITGTLSLLYESEALSQLIGVGKNDFSRFNNTLTRAQNNIDSLRMLVTDSVQIMKIDTINNLLERKRWNTRRLLATLKEANTEQLYRQNIEKVIAVQDTVVEQVKVEERVVIEQDTLVVKKQSKGFFKRLAEVFSPSKSDSGFVVNTTRHVVTDTIVQPFNPSDTIVSILKNLQDNVAGQRRQLDTILVTRSNNLRYNNSVITQRINQLLRDIEQEEMDASLNRVQQKQQLIRDTSHLIGLIAVTSLLVAIVFLFFIWRDISRSQYYRRQLEKAKQYAEDLLHSREKLMLTISHDIRAPLSSIIGYIELLENLRPKERERYYLENMNGSADHILSLVNDLLDFQRLESNQMEIHPIPFFVPVLFDEIYNSFRPIAEGKGLQFVLNQKDEGSSLQYMGDTIRIRQIANNLLSNAIKFTSEGRVVLLVSVQDKSATSAVLSFSVVDAGPGIPLEEQEKIFGEFTRLTSTEGVEGFGLGLSITRKLTERMGGKLSLYSRPGKGSTFEVQLPVEVSTIQAVPVKLPLAIPVYMEPVGLPEKEIHCLLVDDDPLQLAMTKEMLATNNITVICCSDPREVVRILETQPIDIVITDIQMPGTDGFSLLLQIRESLVRGVTGLPVIALSANLAKESDHYIAAGFSAFLNKPFTGKQLLSQIYATLHRKEEVVKDLDFSALTAFAGDDVQASVNILHTFCEETRKNVNLLQHTLQLQDRAGAAKMAHKLIPLFTMLDKSNLVGKLRILEQNEPSLSAPGWEILVKEVVLHISQIVESVEHKLVE